MMDEYLVQDEHGRALTMSDIPSVRLLRGQRAEPLLLNTVHRQTGRTRWQLLKAATLQGEKEHAMITVTVIEDVTAVKTAEVRMRVLSESSRFFASSMDIQETLHQVAQAAIPGLADWCIVDLFDERGNREHVATAHRDPALRELVARLPRFEPVEPLPGSAITEAIRSGTTQVVTDMGDDNLRRAARSEEHLEALRAMQIRSIIVAPMVVRGRPVGTILFGTSSSLRRLFAEDVELAEQLAGRAASAVQTALLQTRLRGVSETLQQSLLPPSLPEVPGWELAGLYHPAGEEERIEVGGDFYEVFRTGEITLAVIGDVTGHGITAATVTSLLRHGARFASRLEPDPAAILSRLDEELRRTSPTLATAMCARLGPGELVLSSAGHPPALAVSRSGEVRELTTAGPLLGAFPDGHWAEETVDVSGGDLVLFYTDGVTETAGPRERFGARRLSELLSRHRAASPGELLAGLDAALSAFREGEAADDVAALALRVAP
jgi:serine phosphatase RsbU (regulator of sigma subunit)